jgi:hypothetical protein
MAQLTLSVPLGRPLLVRAGVYKSQPTFPAFSGVKRDKELSWQR